MNRDVIRVAVTGGAGQICYNLLFRIASGEMFGMEQPIALHIMEVEPALPVLEGVKMELDDCAFPLLKEIRLGSDPFRLFEGVHFALLVGAKPRGPGMERGDLLAENSKIFVHQGKALNAVADREVKVLVVGNPCNTNALIAMANAPGIPRRNFYAMTRLDQNRAMSQLAQKAGVDVSDVSNLVIWGNHSSTQVPDFFNARIEGRRAKDLIADTKWFTDDFIPAVQKRGAAIIEKRGKSSAASAASAAIDSIKSLLHPTPDHDWFSLGICSDGNNYGIEENLIFSFPCRSDGRGNLTTIDDLPWNDFLHDKIKASERELIEERELAFANPKEL